MSIRFASTEPREFSDTDLHSSRIDHFKAQLDIFKHVATLDTGALLVTISLIEKVFHAPVHRYLIGVAAVMFLVSLLSSGLACMMVLGALPRKGATTLDREARSDRLLATSWTFLGFFFGLIALTLFFALNWFR